jgi:CubicO group peptidase (beta-lactamase class C family)
MYKKELMRVKPEAVGLSSRKLLQMIQELEQCGTEMHGLMIERHGKILLECWWEPYDKSLSHICHSMGKSYIGTAVGLACTQGYLSLQDRIVDLFSDEIATRNIEPSVNMKKVTVEHLLMMANGMSVHPASGENLLTNYLSSEFDHESGTRFLYNTTGSCMLGAAVEKVTGKSVREYLTKEIFNKIGVESDKLEWMKFHKNNIYAAPGVASSTENNLRLGMLYLQQGQWDGEQLIDREWMDNATSRRIRTEVINKEAHLDNGAGYGYQLWICPEKDTFKFSGGHGQDVIMSRPYDLVISINQAANDGESKAEDAIISKYLLQPELLPEGLKEDEEGYQALSNYISTLKINDRECNCTPDKMDLWNGIYLVTEGAFHINTELRPMDDTNVYIDFYDHEDVNVKEVSIYYKNQMMELVFDDGTYRTCIHAYLDGKLRPVYSKGAIPIYTRTVSTAFVNGQDLVVETKFLQTCFWTKLIFHHNEDGKYTIQVYKERLHEDNPYIYLEAGLEKMKAL